MRQNVRVMVTDSAVGAQEENNLRHLVTNLGPDVPRTSVVPFLTTKHSIDFCLGYVQVRAVHLEIIKLEAHDDCEVGYETYRRR